MIDTQRIEKRTVQSFYDDGLSEIALGLVFLLLGAYFFAQNTVPEKSLAGSVLSMLFVLVIVSAGFLINHILRFFKRRVTYPRTGYVEFKKKEISPKRRMAVLFLGAIVAASMSALYTTAPSAKALLPAINGLLLGVAFLFFALRVGLTRFYIEAAASVVTGLAISIVGIGDTRGTTLYFGVFGAVLSVFGLAALVAYIRRSPRTGKEPLDAE